MSYITIEYIHVNKLNISAFGQLWYMPFQVGLLRRQDIGKRLYRVPTDHISGYNSHILQMESDEQRTAREESR